MTRFQSAALTFAILSVSASASGYKDVALIFALVAWVGVIIDSLKQR